MSCRDFEMLLDPLVDGELPLSDALRTEIHMAGCDACRAQYESRAALSAEIAEAGLRFEPSRGQLQRLRRTRPGAHRRWWGLAAAMAACLATVLVSPPFAGRTDTVGPEVLDGHLRSLVGARLVDVPSSDRHTVKPWFQGKVAFSPEVPDLSENAFHLVGGRLEVIARERAVALVYKRRDHVINLFITEVRGGPLARRADHLQGYNLVAWTDRRFAYWAVSDLNARELDEFVALVSRK